MMIIFLYYPFFSNILNSFYDMNSWVKMPGQTFDFIGLENYRFLAQDEKVKIALLNSIKMMFLTVVFQVGLAFVLAVMVTSIKKGQQIFRTVFFFPIVISATAIGVLFKLFYNYNDGAFNQLLAMFGKAPVEWLSEAHAFTMISIPTIWSYVGFYFVIMLTGLSNISEDVYEAASIDGCTGFKKVFYVTIPMLKGVICTCITLAVTGALKVFDLPWVIAPKGAPSGLTNFMGTYMYDITYNIGNIDYGATLAFLIVILGVIVSQGLNKLLRADEA